MFKLQGLIKVLGVVLIDKVASKTKQGEEAGGPHQDSGVHGQLKPLVREKERMTS